MDVEFELPRSNLDLSSAVAEAMSSGWWGDAMFMAFPDLPMN